MSGGLMGAALEAKNELLSIWEVIWVEFNEIYEMGGSHMNFLKDILASTFPLADKKSFKYTPFFLLHYKTATSDPVQHYNILWE